MGTKREGVPCYDKAGDDEPLFVLRAQDQFAADTVDHWIRQARAYGCNAEMIAEAERCRAAMRAWPTKKLPD